MIVYTAISLDKVIRRALILIYFIYSLLLTYLKHNSRNQISKSWYSGWRFT